MDDKNITGSYVVNIAIPPNPWARISEVAAKLGIEPIQYGHPATITAVGADGKAYDLWSVISAMIDKMNGSLGEQMKKAPDDHSPEAS